MQEKRDFSQEEMKGATGGWLFQKLNNSYRLHLMDDEQRFLQENSYIGQYGYTGEKHFSLPKKLESFENMENIMTVLESAGFKGKDLKSDKTKNNSRRF